VRREVIEGQDGRFLRLRIFVPTWRRDAVLGILANFGVTGGTVCAARRIAIGDNVTVGANATIIDTHFHPLGSEGRKSKPSGGQTAPVRIRIEDDVFLG
jgi:acetyltransferase-like isoleucine patch superfamily enzyme